MPFPIRVPPDFVIIAHRGASAYAPENTAFAFKLANEMGVYHVELDTQLTRDGQIALCHDENLVRYGYPGRFVHEMLWSELAELDMGAWFSPYFYGGARMWRLNDLFETYAGRFTYHVELKGGEEGLPQAVLQCINDHGLYDRCIITSFRQEQLERMRALDGNVRLGWLVRTIDDTALRVGREFALAQLCPQATFVDAEQVQRAKEVVQEVRAWGLSGTPNEVAELILRVTDAGCDGTTTNWPDWLSH